MRAKGILLLPIVVLGYVGFSGVSEHILETQRRGAFDPTNLDRSTVIEFFNLLSGPLTGVIYTNIMKQGTNAVPYLLKLVDKVHVYCTNNIQMTSNVDRATAIRIRMPPGVQTGIQLALKDLGPDRLRPYAKEFVKRLKSGVGADFCAAALSYIDGEYDRYLIEGLTNVHPSVRAACAEEMPDVAKRHGCTEKVMPYLIQLLKDRSPVVQEGAISALGDLQSMPDKSLPALLEVVKTSTNLVVRLYAIGKMSVYKLHLLPYRRELEALEEQEKDPIVKEMLNRGIYFLARQLMAVHEKEGTKRDRE